MPVPTINNFVGRSDIVLRLLIGSGGYADVYYGWSPRAPFQTLHVKVFDVSPFSKTHRQFKEIQRSWETEVKVHGYARIAEWKYVRWLQSSGEEEDYLWIATMWKPKCNHKPSGCWEFPLSQPFTLCLTNIPEEAQCVGLSIIDRLEHLHTNNIIHGDISPGNIIFSPPKQNAFLIDFGLALHPHRIFPDGSRELIPDQKKPTRGTPRYRSINSLLNHRRTYSSDIESLVYVLLNLLLVREPNWFSGGHISAREELQFKRGLKGKHEFQKFKCLLELHQYVTGLQYGTVPDYDTCRQHIRQLTV